jgi:hypothetical protein
LKEIAGSSSLLNFKSFTFSLPLLLMGRFFLVLNLQLINEKSHDYIPLFFGILLLLMVVKSFAQRSCVRLSLIIDCLAAIRIHARIFHEPPIKTCHYVVKIFS